MVKYGEKYSFIKPMEEIKIGILILNYKTYLDTEKLVCEILAGNSPFKILIQVVDNASPNESYDYLSDIFRNAKNVIISKNCENTGFARGNNFGLRKFSKFAPDYVLILNNDIHFDLMLLSKLVNTYEKLPDAGIISPLQKLPSGKFERFRSLKCNTFTDDLLFWLPFSSRVSKGIKYKSNTSYPNLQIVDIIPGCFLFIDYHLFESVGFFDESTFLFCEERFLYMKMKAIGRKNYLLIDESYLHDHSKTIKQEVSNKRQEAMLLEGQLVFTQKYRHFSWVKCQLLRAAFSFHRLQSNIRVSYHSKQ